MSTGIKKKFDYTWVIVACCFLMMFTSMGFCSSPKQLFLKAATEALGMERSLYSLGTTFRYVTTAIVNLFFGALVIKFGVRKLLGFGFISLIGSTTMYMFANSYWMVYVGGILLGLGVVFLSTTMISYIVHAHCHSHVGTILGFAMCANGLGGAVATQVVSPFIDSSPFGYRNAYLVVAIILFVVGTTIVILYRDKGFNSPVEKKKKKARGEGWDGFTYAVAKKKPYFYPTVIGLFLTGFVLSCVNGISVSHIKDCGVDPVFVKNIWTVHSLVLMASKFFAGWMYDKKGLRTSLLICQVTAVIVMVALALVNNSPIGVFLAAIYAIFSSLALPLETVCMSLVVGDFFGNTDYARILGFMSAINCVGFATGEPLMNLIYDTTGTYTVAIWIAAVAITIVSIMFQFIITAARKDREKTIAEREAAEAEAVPVEA